MDEQRQRQAERVIRGPVYPDITCPRCGAPRGHIDVKATYLYGTGHVFCCMDCGGIWNSAEWRVKSDEEMAEIRERFIAELDRAHRDYFGY